MTRHLQKGPVLIVEDDRKTASLVALYLEREGFETAIAHDGRRGLELAGELNPSLVILDLMLPQVDGWEVCKEIRANSQVPILMLTAREEEMDRVTGLSMGADDYVIKPFSPRELVARVRAILRRTQPQPDKILVSGGLEVDQERRTVVLDGQRILLTPHEFTLLTTLMQSPGKVYSRKELLDKLYPDGDTVVVDRVVDVHIGKLRHKIEHDLSTPRYILTIRGMGYQFAEFKEQSTESA